MERWLHQHLFKVGWLLTHSFHTTTVLYYTFFLPGVLLHETVTWLVAGMVNVRAKGAITWPESQDIGELRLNFVQITQRITPLQQFIISVAPLTVGMLVTWYVANNIFRLEDVLQTMSSGSLADVSAGISQLISIPDFWLWFYLLFTISNTMFSGVLRHLSTWRSLLLVGAVILTAVGIVGITSSLLTSIAISLQQVLTVLLQIIVFLIGINLLVTLFLGTVESLIERITGHSATFRKGRMITMTRAAALAEREKDRSRVARRTIRAPRNPAADSHIRSIYALPFPLPGAPTRDATTQLELALPPTAETSSARSPVSINTPLALATPPDAAAPAPAPKPLPKNAPLPKDAPGRPAPPLGPKTTEKPPEPARPGARPLFSGAAASLAAHDELAKVSSAEAPDEGRTETQAEASNQTSGAKPPFAGRSPLSLPPTDDLLTGAPALSTHTGGERTSDKAPALPDEQPPGVFSAAGSVARPAPPATSGNVAAPPSRPPLRPELKAVTPEDATEVAGQGDEVQNDDTADEAFPDALADETPLEPTSRPSPAPFASPFGRPATPPTRGTPPMPAAPSERSPFAFNQPGTSKQPAPPPALPPADKPAMPRNPVYNQLASRPVSPFQRPSAPPPSAGASRHDDDEAAASLRRLMEPDEDEDDELRYEKDDDAFYSEDDAETRFSDED